MRSEFWPSAAKKRRPSAEPLGWPGCGCAVVCLFQVSENFGGEKALAFTHAGTCTAPVLHLIAKVISIMVHRHAGAKGRPCKFELS